MSYFLKKERRYRLLLVNYPAKVACYFSSSLLPTSGFRLRFRAVSLNFLKVGRPGVRRHNVVGPRLRFALLLASVVQLSERLSCVSVTLQATDEYIFKSEGPLADLKPLCLRTAWF